MKFPRYLLVQIAVYSIDMGVFLLLIGSLAFVPIIANILSKVAAGLFAFFAHRHFTFKKNAPVSLTKQAIKYFVLLLINIPLSTSVLILVLIFIPSSAEAKIISDIICVLMTYWLSKKYVFVEAYKHCSDSCEK